MTTLQGYIFLGGEGSINLIFGGSGSDIFRALKVNYMYYFTEKINMSFLYHADKYFRFIGMQFCLSKSKGRGVLDTFPDIK